MDQGPLLNDLFEFVAFTQEFHMIDALQSKSMAYIPQETRIFSDVFW
jgi:hypothetical protein